MHSPGQTSRRIHRSRHEKEPVDHWGCIREEKRRGYTRLQEKKRGYKRLYEKKRGYTRIDNGIVNAPDGGSFSEEFWVVEYVELDVRSGKDTSDGLSGLHWDRRLLHNDLWRVAHLQEKRREEVIREEKRL